MSLTAICFLLALVLGGLAVGSFIFGTVKDNVFFIISGAVLVGMVVAASIAGAVSYNDNIRESQNSCLANSGVIYSNKCVDRVPLEIQKL
ncbi:hypothetical protein FDI69_gp243 [Rhodococcus phage Trina]|uniref:Uncharacterized protein n=1 Tax=Rhodococcus phage Trina TaxID=2027905 RepID=A0A2D1ADP6_9CAUD|nr:hypothetical protein FDI69_gp243 [Rhodococcus phage Trina]ASZ74944.1 hypothetical protein SEA_TRINA_139 [Rhodococcus phage Trina]